ncbi:MAG: hypothetical protein BWY67_02019 [Bacteroidetes bacterium ADurb.Bin397]|nr:MAG: hypothetical protein BWY67_02019 [Bacteroidetes bacterium ADurb.Bin397]
MKMASIANPKNVQNIPNILKEESLKREIFSKRLDIFFLEFFVQIVTGII